jgi:cell division septation protein DedD
VAPGDASVTPAATSPVAEPPAEPQAQAAAPLDSKTQTAEVPHAEINAPGPGQTFLQVAAVKRPEAELIVDVLKKKGFRALVSPVVIDGQPSDALFRALVGPLKDPSEVAKTKSDLEAAGFKPIIRKY